MPFELTPEQKLYESSLSRVESKTAIYIDFEGFMNKSPTLIGYCCEADFVQVVFDRALQSAALAKGLSQGATTIRSMP